MAKSPQLIPQSPMVMVMVTITANPPPFMVTVTASPTVTVSFMAMVLQSARNTALWQTLMAMVPVTASFMVPMVLKVIGLSTHPGILVPFTR